MTQLEIDDSKNPFSQNYVSSSKDSDFGTNQFASEQAKFPQFGNVHTSQKSGKNIMEQIESAKANGWGAQLTEFIRSHKKRLAIIIAVLVLFAGGSYSYMFNKNNLDNAPAIVGGNISSNLSDQSIKDNDTNSDNLKNEPAETDANVLDIKINENGEVIFDENQNSGTLIDGSSITKTAGAGEGITHLARSAIKDYLAASGKNISAEQKIYAEDYVQNRVGSEYLEIGQKLSFSNDLLDEAVREAQGLANWQLENLKQYTSSVSLL